MCVFAVFSVTLNYVLLGYNFLHCSQGLHGWESDDDGDMDDEDSIVTALGCLGPLGGLLAPEIQRYQKHLKGKQQH